MSFSPFDPEVMRVTLGRNRPAAGGKSDIDRIAENAPFEEARLKSTYREMEKRFADLLALDFVKEDPESVDRLQQLFYAIDIEDFSKRFDHFAEHVLARLEAMGSEDDAGAAARARLRAGLGKMSGSARTSGTMLQSPFSLMNDEGRAAPETDRPNDPAPPRPRMRLRL